MYTDIVKSVTLGDSFQPLLAIVQTPPSSFPFGDQFTVHFTEPQYKPVNNLEFNEMSIYIRDDFGGFIKFQFGRVIINIRFRPKHKNADESLHAIIR